MSSGSSDSSSSTLAFAEDAAAAWTPFGLMTSNSVVFVFVLEELGMEFLMGGGAGFAGTY